MEQRLHKILCTVYTLVNHDTNPQSLIELISQGDTTYAKSLSKVARAQHRKLKCSVKSHEPEIKVAGNICLYLEILLGDLS